MGQHRLLRKAPRLNDTDISAETQSATGGLSYERLRLTGWPPQDDVMQRTSAKLLYAVLAVGLLSSAGRGLCAQPSPEPPRFTVPVSAAGGRLTFVAYGDTRFSQHEGIANPIARRALVERIARENPAAILIGGDLVYEGSNPDDYRTYKNETTAWSERRIPVFPALGNHEFRGCTEQDATACLENWWQALKPLPLRPYRWYAVTIGPTLLALLLDSTSALRPGSEQRMWLEHEISDADPRINFIVIVMHYPPVRDPFYPSMKDEQEVERLLTAQAPALRARVVVIGSHVHNYERYVRQGVVYVVSGGGGAKPVPAARMFGELSKLTTAVNFHYLRFTLEGERLTGTMVRFDAEDHGDDPWTEPDHFEIKARDADPRH